MTLLKTEAWAYDVTLGGCIALLWWTAEYFSFASQRRLRLAADFNLAWSVLTCALIMISAATLILEHFLRDLHGASVPTAVATIVAASISIVVIPERLRLFDGGAVVVQRILRADKVRFGYPGSLGLSKFIIEWRCFKQGSLVDSGWDEVETRERPNEQVLVDWSIDHRLGRLDEVDVAYGMRRGGDGLNAMLGILLYAWLPRQSIEVLRLPLRLRTRGALRRGYQGIRGIRIGCRPDDVSFDSWFSGVPVKPEVFQLVTVEFSHATLAFASILSVIAEQAENAEDLARLFVESWDEEIEKAEHQRASKTGIRRTTKPGLLPVATNS